MKVSVFGWLHLVYCNLLENSLCIQPYLKNLCVGFRTRVTKSDKWSEEREGGGDTYFSVTQNTVSIIIVVRRVLFLN